MNETPVFLSYARSASLPAARALRDALVAQGVGAFLDEREIAFGEPFPAALAQALHGARVVVVFASAAYAQRPWCVHELGLATAAWLAGDDQGLQDAVVALDPAGEAPALTAWLPPPLAAGSWPRQDDTAALVELVRCRLAAAPPTLAQRLGPRAAAMRDALASGADQPLPWAAVPAELPQVAPAVWRLGEAPAVRGEGFVGRADLLWQLAFELVLGRCFTPARHVVLQGLGGSGKSLLAAEFVARHAPQAFAGGVVWVAADGGRAAAIEAAAALWRHLDAATPPPADWGALCLGLRAMLSRRVVAGSLLWVIDGLPEPGQADAGGIADWCPAPQQLAVLVTTRRADRLEGSDATLAVGPLQTNAAVQLLVRPPVDRGWLDDDDWQAITRWAGALPLVLSLLRASLIDGSLSLDELRTAPQLEPASEADRLMDQLRGEVDDRSLRGAADAFALSWRALASDPALARAAGRLALLAPVALTEPLLKRLLSSADVGRLVRRGWLQPAALARTFLMHRVPASVLRVHSPDPEGLAADTLRALAACADLSAADWTAARVDLHTHSAMRRSPRSVGDRFVAAAEDLVRASCAQLDPERRGWRFLAAELANDLGLGDVLVQQLRSHSQIADEQVRLGLPHLLQALRDSPAAIAWMAELLADPHPPLRSQMAIHAPPVQALVEPLLRLQLDAADGTAAWDPTIQSPSLLDGLLSSPALLRTVIGWVLRLLGDAPPAGRAHLAGVLGRALVCSGRDLAAGGWTGPILVARLLRLALSDPDAQVREAAAAAAAQGAGALDAGSWSALVTLVDNAAPDVQRRAVEAVGHYLVAASRASGPGPVTIARDDEGHVRLSGQLFGTHGLRWPTEAVPQLAQWVLALPPEAAAAAASVIVGHRQGQHDIAPWIHTQLDAGAHDAVWQVADALARAGAHTPLIVNACWWRGQAAAALGRPDEAVADFEQVLSLAPQFDDARQALLVSSHGAACAALNAGQPARAEDWARRVLAMRPGLAEAQWFLALACERQQRPAEALDAARQAVALDADDARYRQTLARLLST